MNPTGGAAVAAVRDLTPLCEFVRRVDLPVVFLGADGRITDRNPAAVAAMADAHPWLRDRAGRLFVAVASGWQHLGPALQTLGPDVVVLDLVNNERRWSTLALMPVPGASTDPFAQHPAVAIASLRRGARDKSLALRQAYGLTAAEARVAVQLAEGRSAGQLADAMGLSITTIRTHIAAAMGKLGVDRQAQLVSVVLGL